MNYKKYLKPLGYIIAILCSYFIYKTLSQSDFSELKITNPWHFFLYLFLLGFSYFFIIVITALTWQLNLEFFNTDGKALSGLEIMRVYLLSNIAKYLPGNVLHYAGRNILGKQLGWSHEKMLMSTLLEIIMAIFVTFLLFFMFFYSGLIYLPKGLTFSINAVLINKLLITSVAVFIIGLISILILYKTKKITLPSISTIRSRVQIFFSISFIYLFFKSFLLILASFILNGIIYYLLCNKLLNIILPVGDFFNIESALTISGFAGILTPGVPGGMGAKESVSVTILSMYGYNSGVLVLSIIIFRVITIIGDGIGFLVANFILTKKNTNRIK